VAIQSNPEVDHFELGKLSPPLAERLESRYFPAGTYSDDDDSATPLIIDELADELFPAGERLPAHWTARLAPKANDFALHMRNASPADAGLYLARVSNSAGHGLWLCRVIVNSKFVARTLTSFVSPSPSFSSPITFFFLLLRAPNCKILFQTTEAIAH